MVRSIESKDYANTEDDQFPSPEKSPGEAMKIENNDHSEENYEDDEFEQNSSDKHPDDHQHTDSS